MKFRCDRDDLSEALQTVQRGVSSRPGIPALTGVLLEAADDGTPDAHDDGPGGLGAALDRRPGPGGRRGAGAGSAARRHGEVALGGTGRLRDGPVPGTHPLRGVRGRAPAAARRRLPGAAGAVGDARSRSSRRRSPRQSRRCRRAASKGRGPAGAHGCVARDQPGRCRPRRHGLVPPRRPRPRRHRRR